MVFRHALRNALIPIMTGLGGFLSLFFAGSIIIEQQFNIDGMGLLSFRSLLVPRLQRHHGVDLSCRRFWVCYWDD